MSTAALRADPMTPLEMQLAVLAERYPGAFMQDGGGVNVVSVPSVRLPDGWSKREVTVHFLVPVGFPHANPDCFNTDPELTLGSGALPKNTAPQVMPAVGNTLWFSWHLQRPWRPGRDTLLTWMGVVNGRFAERA